MADPQTGFTVDHAPILTDPEVVNLAPFPFAITDIETGDFVYMNEMVRACFCIGNDQSEQLNVSSLYTDLEIRAKLVEIILRTGRITDCELTLRRRDGTLIWVLASAQLVRFRGRLCSLIAVVDITKIKHLTDDLEKTQRDLTQTLDIAARLQEATERDSRAKSTLLVNLSHEIRTPLNGIIGMSQILIEEDLSAEMRSYVEAIQQAAMSLHAVTSEILEHTEFDSKEVTPCQVQADPAEVISSAIRQIGHKIGTKQLEISTFIGAEVPRSMVVDSIRLQQALVHLLGNAVKFSESGTITIACSYNLGHLSISITDTGIGIPAEHIGDIFHDFLQADNRSTRKYGGIGLGLSIVQKAIACMGGDIHVESVEGEGTTFTFMIPIASASNTKIRQSGDSGRRATIYTDNNDLARMFDNVLSHAGYCSEALQLGDWDGAISLTDDLVLLDLPNDADRCRNIVSMIAAIPEMLRKHIVCLSHRHTFPNSQTIGAMAPVRFISKPTDPYSLCNALKCHDIWNSPIVEEDAEEMSEIEDCHPEPTSVFLPLVESIERDWGEIDDLFIRRIASLLSESCEKCIEGIALGIDREDPVLVYAYAYQLYGSTMNAGAVSTAQLCRKVLEAARTRNFASATSLLPLIQADLARFQESIDWQLTRKEA